MKHYKLEHPQGRVRVTEWGKPEAPVVLCLHGLGSTALSFIEIAAQIEDTHRVVAIDLPGHGHSAPFASAEAYEMHGMVAWLAGIVSSLSLGSFRLLSHSYGAVIGLFYQAAFPERVEGSILIDGGYHSKRLSGTSMEDEIAYYERDFEESIPSWSEFLRLTQSGIKRWSPLLDIAARDLALERDGRFYWHARGLTAGRIIRSLHIRDVSEVWDRVPRGNTLLQATLPEESEYRTRCVAAFEQRTGAVVERVPGTSHMLHWDDPGRVVAEIRQTW